MIHFLSVFIFPIKKSSVRWLSFSCLYHQHPEKIVFLPIFPPGLFCVPGGHQPDSMPSISLISPLHVSHTHCHSHAQDGSRIVQCMNHRVSVHVVNLDMAVKGAWEEPFFVTGEGKAGNGLVVLGNLGEEATSNGIPHLHLTRTWGREDLKGGNR